MLFYKHALCNVSLFYGVVIITIKMATQGDGEEKQQQEKPLPCLLQSKDFLALLDKLKSPP